MCLYNENKNRERCVNKSKLEYMPPDCINYNSVKFKDFDSCPSNSVLIGTVSNGGN